MHSKELMQEVAPTPEAECKPLEDKPAGGEQDVASMTEFNFVSNADGYCKGPEIIRYVAVRRPRSGCLGLEENEIPARNGGSVGKIRVLITSIPAPGRKRADGEEPDPMTAAQVLELASGRCGDAEHAHSALKSELAGGTLPCGRLRANAAWWQGAILAMNLHAWVRHCAFDGNLRRAQWKRVRAVVLIHDRTYRKARRIVLIADNHVIHKSGITGRCLASNPKFELVFQRVL